jgi:plastocyanin
VSYLLSLAVALALVLPGTGAGAARAPKPATHTIAMDGTAFSPDDLTVKVGDTVVWINKDPFPHTATSTSGAFDSKILQPGDSFKYKATTKGDFPYICALHPTMKGMLRVE